MYVHYKLADAAISSEIDLSVSLSNQGEAIDFIAHQFVTTARNSFHRDRVISQTSDKAISLGRLFRFTRSD